MCSPIERDDVEAEPILENGLHLTSEEVDLRGRLALVSVADPQESVAHLAFAALPHVAEAPLRALLEVAALAVAGLGVALGLVQRVLARRDVSILKGEKTVILKHVTISLTVQAVCQAVCHAVCQAVCQA